jgi:hypothetical protein
MAYARSIGIKAHANTKIPCSLMMRAVISSNRLKGVPLSRQRSSRASAYASAIDYAIRTDMSEQTFAAELDLPRKVGERHGIEFLAARGRDERRAAEDDPALPDLTLRLAGDHSHQGVGRHLLIADVGPDGTDVAFLKVPPNLLRRALAAHARIAETRASPMDQGMLCGRLLPWLSVEIAVTGAFVRVR